MDKSTRTTLLNVALYAGGAYVVYLILSKLWNKGKDAAKPVADLIANTYSAIALPGDVQNTTRIRLPSGALIDPAQGNFLSIGDNTAQWAYSNRTYTLGPRDASGVYPAS